MKELQDFGLITEEYTEDSPKYNAKILREICKNTGKTLSELTSEEVESARTN